MIPRSLFVVDDHPVFRMGLAQLVEAESDLKVVGSAETGDEALNSLAELQADLVLVDLTLPGMTGLELVEELRRREPARPVLVISMHDGDRFARRALAAGALGFLNKQAAPAEILAAIRASLSGQAMHLDFGPAPPELTPREEEVFLLTGQGLGTRQVAEQLGIGIKTVETHKAHIKAKVGVSNATELVREAVAWAAHRG